MKIYDKKNFWGRIISLAVYAFISAAASYLAGDSFSYTPSLFIIIVTLNGISETMSEEKTKINMERQQKKNRIVENHFGKNGKIISNGITVALMLSVLVMYFNFGLGIAMFFAVFVINSIVMKPVNEQLRQVNEAAKARKNNIDRNTQI